MSSHEETIEATLDSNGQLRLTHPPRLPPGPVRVTIRAAAVSRPRRCLADVIREIAAEQRSRGFPGRSAADIRAEDDACHAEDAPHFGPRRSVSAVLPGHGDCHLRRRGQPC
jgi:hypothetical protein